MNLIASSSVKQLIPEPEVTNSTTKEVKGEKWEGAILALQVIDHIFNWFFIFEYLIRFICSPRKLIFFFKPLNLVDLFAILPYFAGIIIGDLVSTNILARLGRVLRLVRIIRILRVFKFIRHFPALQSLVSSVLTTSVELGLLSFMIFLAAAVLGSLLYFAEQETDNRWLYLDSVWWILFSLVNSGADSEKPSTIPGIILGILCLMLGLVFVTLPLPIVWTCFSIKYRQLIMTNQMKSMKKERKELGRKTTVVESPKEVEMHLEKENHKSPENSKID